MKYVDQFDIARETGVRPCGPTEWQFKDKPTKKWKCVDCNEVGHISCVGPDGKCYANHKGKPCPSGAKKAGSRKCADCGKVIPAGQRLCNCNRSGDLG